MTSSIPRSTPGNTFAILKEKQMPANIAQSIGEYPSLTMRDETAELHPAQDVLCYLRNYASRHPDVAALWCLGIGFVLGWKLKPW